VIAITTGGVDPIGTTVAILSGCPYEGPIYLLVRSGNDYTVTVTYYGVI
jgi:hypothetical protein